jgi:hypothetical protein
MCPLLFRHMCPMFPCHLRQRDPCCLFWTAAQVDVFCLVKAHIVGRLL